MKSESEIDAKILALFNSREEFRVLLDKAKIIHSNKKLYIHALMIADLMYTDHINLLNWVLDKEVKENAEGNLDTIKLQLDSLSDYERVELFSNYCKHCGENDPKCQCWNDD